MDVEKSAKTKEELNGITLRESLCPLEERFFGSTPKEFGSDTNGLRERLDSGDLSALEELLTPIIFQRNKGSVTNEKEKLEMLKRVQSVRERERLKIKKEIWSGMSLSFIDADQGLDRIVIPGLYAWVRPSDVTEIGQVESQWKVYVFDEEGNILPIKDVFPQRVELSPDFAFHDYLSIQYQDQESGEPYTDHFVLKFALPGQSQS